MTEPMHIHNISVLFDGKSHFDANGGFVGYSAPDLFSGIAFRGDLGFDADSDIPDGDD